MPGFNAAEVNGDRAIAYAESLQEIIRALVVAGVGPVLGEGIAGIFVGLEDELDRWFYRDGAAGIRTLGQIHIRARLPDRGYRLQRGAPPVAVLTGENTSGSGEGVTISFRGRPMTRSFGSATFGLSTGNAGFSLPDGSTIVLTIGIMADRTGILYGSAVEPDEFVPGAM